VLRRSIRRDHRGRRFMTTDEDLEQVFGGRRAEPLHAEILEHEEIDGGETLHQVAALAGGVRFSKILRELEGTAQERVIAGANRAAAACSRRSGNASAMPESRKCRRRVVSCGCIRASPGCTRLTDGWSGRR